jgi:hypothetical protein
MNSIHSQQGLLTALFSVLAFFLGQVNRFAVYLLIAGALFLFAGLVTFAVRSRTRH